MICPFCHATVMIHARFCAACGHSLSTAAQGLQDPGLGSPSGVSGELRVVTVLFADLKGFTGFSETRKPEEVRDTIDVLFSRFRRELEARGGHVDKYIGDAVMAVFGAPVAHEDDPKRAIDAGLAMLTTLQQYNDENSVQDRGDAAGQKNRLQMRIGINTGEVIWSAIGGEPATVIGDAVNVAQRLEALAEPGTILIGHSTQRLAVSDFLLRIRPAVTLKGRCDAVQPYLVVRRRRTDPTCGKVYRNLMRGEMVGRDSELSRLKNAYRDAISGSSPVFMLLTGEAGVGKSRLLREFTEFLVDSPDMVVCLSGRCISYGSGPLQPIREMVLKYMTQDLSVTQGCMGVTAGISDDQLALRAHAIERVRSDLAVLGRFNSGILDDVADVLVTSVIDTSQADDHFHRFGPKERHDLLLLGLSGWFNALGACHPTVLVIEDMHWADATSQEVLEHYMTFGASWFPGVPVRQAGCGLLILLLARGELAETWPFSKVWPGHRMVLEKLGNDAIASILSTTLRGTYPVDFMNYIIDQSSGNPYHAEELVNYLVETGRIITSSTHGGANQTKSQMTTWLIKSEQTLKSIVPSSLQGILDARIDNLPAKPRHVLTAAAVIGRIFWEHMVAGLVKKTVREEIMLLEQRDFILGHADTWTAGDDEYVFKHALLREVTYQRLPRKERRRFHLEVVATLEQQPTIANNSSLLALKAWHQTESGSTLQAIETYALAAEKASLQGMSKDGIHYLGLALTLLSDSNDLVGHDRNNRLAELLEARGDLRILFNLFDKAWQDYSDAQEKSEKLEVKISCTRKRARIQYLRSNVIEAGKLFAEAMTLADHDPLQQVSILNDMAEFRCVLLGDYPGAERICRQIFDILACHQPDLTLFREFDGQASLPPGASPELRMMLAKTFNQLGFVKKMLGEYEQSLRYLEKACNFSNQEGFSFIKGIANAHMGMVHYARRDMANALACFQKSLEINRATGFLYNVGLNYGYIGAVYLEQGDLDRARENFNSYLSLGEEIGNRLHQVIALDNLGRIHVERNELDQAVPLYEKALTLIEEVGHWKVLSIILRNFGLCHHSKGDLTQAAEFYRRALEISITKDDRTNIGILHELIGKISLDRGNLDEAYDYFQKSLAICHECGDKVGEAEAVLDQSIVYRERGDHDQARQLNEKARRLFEESGMSIKLTECWYLHAESDLDAGEEAAARESLSKAEELYRHHRGGEFNWRIAIGSLRVALAEHRKHVGQSPAVDLRSIHDRAIHLLERARQSACFVFITETLLLIGQILLAMGNTGEARRAFEEVHSLACTHEFGLLRSRILKGSGLDL